MYVNIYISTYLALQRRSSYWKEGRRNSIPEAGPHDSRLEDANLSLHPYNHLTWTTDLLPASVSCAVKEENICSAYLSHAAEQVK